jgi:hypothetical protein
MRLVNAPAEPTFAPPPTACPTSEKLLDIDADLFRAKFGQEPFLIGHELSDHPLFAMDRLMRLARTLPEKNVEYNAGELPISVDPNLTPRNGLTIDETIHRIEHCKSWMVLKYVETDPAYRDLLERCLAEIRPHSEPLHPGMCKPEAFIFLTSPHSVTPYHIDPEHNFLLQIRGSKIVHEFDGRDRSVLSDEELERFYQGAHRNLTFKEEFRTKSWAFNLNPGYGLHFPVTYPHYVANGPEVSVSFSVTFRTPDLDRRYEAYQTNAWLRRRGWNPTGVGVSPWRDKVKSLAFRVARKASGLFGKRDA